MSKQSKEEILVRMIIAMALVIGVLLVIGSVSPTLEMYGL